MAHQGDRKKCWLAVVAAFVAVSVLDFVLHNLVLGDVYRRPEFMALWNPEPVMKSRMWAMFVSHLVFALAATKIYSQGYIF